MFSREGWAGVLARTGGGWVAGLMVAAAAAATPVPVGSWDFETPADLLRPTAGRPLGLVGSHTAVAGPRTGDRAVRIGPGSHYECDHRIAPGAGQDRVNRYSLLIDFRLPAVGPWYCFFQTDAANVTDGDCFVRAGDGAIGVGQSGYSTRGIEADRWYRLVVAVDAAAGTYRLYVDGDLWLDGNPPPVDGRFSLEPTLLLFADEDGEDAALDVARVAIYDVCLTEAEVVTLGGVIPAGGTNQAPVVLTPGSGPSTVATSATAVFGFRASDPDGDAVSVRVDWGDGSALEPWSAAVASGQKVELAHVYRRPGPFVIRVLARDARGALGVWTDALTVMAEGEPVVEFRTPPYLQNVRSDGISILWELDFEVAAEVEFGVPPAFDGRVAATGNASGAGTTIYRAVLTGLLPGTTYQYRTRNGGGAGLGGTFRTAPAGRPDFVFTVWSDSQGENYGAYPADPLEPTKAMFRHMATNGVDFAVTCGDLAENGAAYSDTREYYLDRVALLLGRTVPWFVAWGNHDGGADTVIRRFADLPGRWQPARSPAFGSYSFNYAGCHFICVDYASMTEDLDGWLEGDLKSAAARQARFTFVFIHVPPFCELWIDGNAWLRETLVPLMEAHGVDACFSGHTHEYERGELNGVFYCITGGGSWLDAPEVLVEDWPHLTVGGQHAIPGVVKPGPTRGGGLVNEYVRVEVRGDSFTATMLGFAPDGRPLGVLDTFGKGTPPEDPLVVTAVARVPEGLRIEWTGPVAPCRVQARSGVAAGGWADRGPVIPAGQQAAVVSIGAATEFFRLRLVP